MKRHTDQEIDAKLRKARQMEGEGIGQAAVCKTLGISVMTLHRWRKDRGSDVQPNEPALEGASDGSVAAQFDGDIAAQIDDLRRENGRLRRIVTDLLLEKARLEETVVVGVRAPKRVGR